MWGSAFSSPFPRQLHDTPVILVQTRSLLASVDPEAGTVLWQQEIPAFRGMNIQTPTVVDDSVFTSSYGGRSFSYRVSREDGRWYAQEQWTNKDQGYMSSPVVIDEVAGQLVTYLATGVALPGAIAGIFVFGVLDIIKPWAANKLESLHGRLGIMADDVMAAVYGKSSNSASFIV